MLHLKLLTIELIVACAYAILMLVALKLCQAAGEAGYLQGRGSGSIILLAVGLPPWLSGRVYRAIAGHGLSYGATWRMGLLFTVANGLLAEVLSLRQALHDSLAGYYPIQQLGIVALIGVASLLVSAGLVGLGGRRLHYRKHGWRK
jgi:hypothetical protein